MTTKTLKDFPELIRKLIDDPLTFTEDNDIKTIVEVIKYALDKYQNSQSVISDDLYDYLIDYVKENDPNNKVLKIIGTVSKNKVVLPYYMGSMNKIKPSNQKDSASSDLYKWLKMYKDLEYVYSDKLDGVSALFTINNNETKLYTRGDGKEGSDISHLIKYISSIKDIKYYGSIAVRGELIISIKNFKKYQDKMANARNMVSGLVNSKTPDPEILKDLEFVAYEKVSPWLRSQDEQWENLFSLGFKVVFHEEFDADLNFTNLSTVLGERKEESEYEIDGIIISSNVLPGKRSNSGNPTYAFAFKNNDLNLKAEVEVLEVKWAISKDNYIKPVLSLKPTKLSGVSISNVTANNARFVNDNILGPGAIIKLVRSGDVIPKIVEVIKPATSGKPQMPEIEYIWTETNVDIIAVEESDEQKIKELTSFFKKLDIKNIDDSTTKKLLEAKIDTIPKILNLKLSDLENIDGIGEKLRQKLYTNITERLKSLNMVDIMIASNIFGHGLGERKIKKVQAIYPDIIELYQENETEDIIDKVKEIDGFDVKTATGFATGLNNFIVLFNKLKPDMRKQLRASLAIASQAIASQDNKLGGLKIIFSGFRNKEWEKIIEANGGTIQTSVSSNTDILVSKQEDIDQGSNAKIAKALKLDKKVISKEDFEQEYLANLI